MPMGDRILPKEICKTSNGRHKAPASSLKHVHGYQCTAAGTALAATVTIAIAAFREVQLVRHQRRRRTQLCPGQLACSILKPVSVGTTSEFELAAALQARWDLHMQ